jgi:hypothetical protein
VNELNRNFSNGELKIANKNRKKGSVSLAINEMQIKTTLRVHLTPIRMGIIKNTNKKLCWGCREKKRTLIYCWWECKLTQLLWKVVWRFHRN